MCIVVVSSLYLCTSWPFNSVLQNAKHHHLPTLSLPNSCPQLEGGNQSRASSGEVALVPHFCPYIIPSPAPLEPTLRGLLPQQGLIENEESSLQDSVQKPGTHQEHSLSRGTGSQL